MGRLKNSYNKRGDISRDEKDTEEIDEFKLDTTSVWSNNGDIFIPCQRVVDRLPSGCYDCTITTQGDKIFELKDIVTDDHVTIKDSKFDDILKEVYRFWEIGDKFQSRGFIHKRGILLAGPAGCGKTTLINMLIHHVTKKEDGIVLFLQNPVSTSKCLQDLRKLEKDRPIMVVIEDIDDVIGEYGERGLLALLDGDSQIDNVIFIATTNYVEKLKDRFVKRPSRFDTITYMSTPSEEMREQFFLNKEPNVGKRELNKWVTSCDGLTFAQMKEFLIMVKCFEYDVSDAIKKLKDFDIKDIQDNDTKKPIGFCR